MTEQTPNQLPSVYVVILTWNDTEMTSRCIESIQRNDYPKKEIVVVDNGSKTSGCPILKEKYPELHAIQLEKNYGFTGGCNRGLQYALDNDADYIFLLNNDTIVQEEAINHLVNELEASPEAAMASSVLLFPGDEKRMQFYRGIIQREVARHMHPGENEIHEGDYLNPTETEFAPACAVMFRASSLKKVGLFDETLFTNWEDYDLCCRFLDAGEKIITVGKAEVVHAHGQTTGKISPFITYFFIRNRLICLFRYARLADILKNSPFLLRTFLWQVRGYGLNNWSCHWAFTKGILHFCLGVRGDHAPKNTKDRKKS